MPLPQMFLLINLKKHYMNNAKKGVKFDYRT